MEKYTICALVLMLGLASATTIGSEISLQYASLPAQVCGANQYNTPSGCWNSCTDPRFRTCGDFFPALYNPSFCAYTRDGQYISYTYECQACQNTNVVAVRSGACSCDFIRCATNQICRDGQCVNLTPVDPVPCTKLCPRGTICQNNQCVPQVVIDRCSLVRCAAGYVCQDGQCVIANPCALIRCGFGYFCDNGQCIDRCAVIRCREGYDCKEGECVPRPGYCNGVLCAPGHSCVNGQCILSTLPSCNARRVECTLPRPDETTCPTRYYLIAPTPNFCGITSTGEQIGFPEECDACKDTSVQYYWTGRCEDIRPCVEQPALCYSDANCQVGFSCEAQRCVDRCATVKCYSGTHCVQGQCVPNIQPPSAGVDSCAAVTCLVGTYCVNGRCIAMYPTKPVVEPVVDLCHDVICIATTTCVNGQCVPLAV